MFVGGVIAIALSIVFFKIYKKQQKIDVALDTELLLITVPKDVSEKEEEGKKDIKEVISFSEQMFANLYSISKPKKKLFKLKKYVTFEIVANDNKISFYISTPRNKKDLVEKIITAQYPKAIVERVEDYNIFNPGSSVFAEELRLAEAHILPIKTYKHLETDPLSSVTNSLSKLDSDEGAAIQILIQPADPRWGKNASKIVSKMVKEGKTLSSAMGGGSILKDMGSELGSGLKAFSKTNKPDSNQPPQLSQYQQEVSKMVEEKANKLAFETKIRIVASSSSKEKAEMLVTNIISSFTQFSNPGLNRFDKPKFVLNRKQIVQDYIFRRFGSDKKIMTLNTEELASIFHPPTRALETPNLNILESRKTPAPNNLSKDGVTMGENNYRGVATTVKISRKDRERHLYTIGTTGSGKTTLLENMCKQDILNGDGVCVLDPHGSFVEDILSIIPKERAEDVVLFDPGDTERPIGLNMLECNSSAPEQRDLVVNEMIAIFHKLFPPEMTGPIFEHNMRNVMLTLMEDMNDPGTIVEIPRMFTDEEFAKEKLKHVKDPIVRQFWEKEMAKTSDFHKSEMLGYLVSKVGQFVENSLMRNILGQQKSGLDFAKIMNEGKILLCNLSKGKVGDINSSLLGLIIQSRLQIAAFERVKIPEEERKPFYVYMDEFQNFVTPTIATVLSEARKYKLILNLAHQYIAQLVTEKGSEVRDAVFGNVGTICVYRVGAQDAEYLEKEFHPVFTQSDLIHTERFHANLKLMVDGTTSRPFTMKAFAFEKGDDKNREIIRELSRLKYGKAKEQVDADIGRRAKLGGTAPAKDRIPEF